MSSRLKSSLTTSHGTVLDGIVFRRNTAKPEVGKKTKRAPQPSQQVHSRLRRSMTLMRQSVPRPNPTPAIKADVKRRENRVSFFNSPGKKFLPKPNPQRLARSKQVIKNSKISRFGASLAPLPTPKTVVAPTVSKLSSRVASAANLTRSNSAALVSQNSGNGGVMIARPMAVSSPDNHQRLEAMLDKALQQADAHKRILQNSVRRGFWHRIGRAKGFTLISAILVLVTLALSFAYLKVPAFSAKVASLRSGVSAQAPAYLPPGFSLSSTSFKNGVVSMKFSGGAGSFIVTQQKSDLNSDSLKANVVVPASKLYQTAQYNGVTVYTYSQISPQKQVTPDALGNGNISKLSDSGELTSPDATWVDHGIQAIVTNQANLSSDQLTKIIQGLLPQ